ncbi:MAG: hypothetical protein II543_01605, partial [Desulfovibrio sp.]|nr:hypothetical protein [Desulfovibrio sp.]
CRQRLVSKALETDVHAEQEGRARAVSRTEPSSRTPPGTAGSEPAGAPVPAHVAACATGP